MSIKEKEGDEEEESRTMKDGLDLDVMMIMLCIEVSSQREPAKTASASQARCHDTGSLADNMILPKKEAIICVITRFFVWLEKLLRRWDFDQYELVIEPFLTLVFLFVSFYYIFQEKDGNRCCFCQAGPGSYQGQWTTHRKHPAGGHAP